MQARETALVLVFLAASAAFILLPSASFSLILHTLGFHEGAQCPLGYESSSPAAGPHVFTQIASSRDKRPSQTLFFNCTVFTSDIDNPTASAFVVTAGNFAFVGSHSAALAHLKLSSSEDGADLPPNPVKINLQGAYVTPGLIDSHVHLIPGGLSLSRLDLAEVSTKQQFINAITAATQTATPGQWILGGNWDENLWGGELPAASWIDAATPDNPVFLTRSDAHSAIANTLAMKIVGLTKDTPDPPGGVIMRLQTQEPTGLVADAAMLLISQHIPESSHAERLEALFAAQDHALEHGITAVHDMGRVAFQEGGEAAWTDFQELLLPAAGDGRLKIRVRAFLPLPTWRRLAERVKYVGTEHPSKKLSWGALKEFYDGSLGSRTALMHAPYEDGGKSNIGTCSVDRMVFKDQVEAAHASGLQVAVHAIGDRAVDEVLEVFSTLKGTHDVRHRIEHAQHLHSNATAELMASLGIMATPNPLHVRADSKIVTSRLGVQRTERAYAFKSLMRAGVKVAFASDWPVAPLDALKSIRLASTAERFESVSPSEALMSQTYIAAVAGMQEEIIGRIRVGLHADFAVFDGDMLDLRAENPPRVVRTYVDGTCQYGCEASKTANDVKDEL